MKAMLIMEMPECCYICPITSCDADNMSTSSRSEDCPLKRIPDHIKGELLTNREHNQIYKAGYNACLDNILGKQINISGRTGGRGYYGD